MSGNPSSSSSSSPNFAGTLATGIQDVAALLPLLGTEQCERHAADALRKGYLYAAILPASLFGSLGAVKVAFAVWLASITYPFYGGRWLEDAGFGTAGSVSSLVTIAKDTGRYGAEVAVDKLLKEQNITDVTLVKEFTISDGRKTEYKDGTTSSDVHPPSDAPKKGWKETASQLSWNTMLIICSLFTAVVAITPYLYLMSNMWDEPLSWLFPLLRSFGSSLCVVVIQLALQRRIHRLANLSLEWRKLQVQHRFEDDLDSSELVLEQRICKRLGLKPSSPLTILRHLRLSLKFPFLHHNPQCLDDPENPPQTPKERNKLLELLAPDWTLMLYQLALAVGMAMTVAGYVGCFSLVNKTSVKNGSYVWFGLETVLSLLRIIVWGWNPKWDEGTGLSMSLQLREMQEPTDVKDEFIHVTSPYSQYDLKLARDKHGYYESSPQSFIAYNEESFLGMVTPWVGPLQPLGSSLVTLFYSILLEEDDKEDGAEEGVEEGEEDDEEDDKQDDNLKRKELYTTVYFADSRPTLTFPINKPDVIFSSTFETNPIARAVQITILNKAITVLDSFIGSPLDKQIREHCRNLRTRLFCRQRIERLAVMWNVDSLPVEHSKDSRVDSEELSEYDRKYIALREVWTAKTEYCEGRQEILEQLKSDDEYSEKAVEWEFGRPASFVAEALFIAESAILEIQLWSKEKEQLGDEKKGQFTRAECIRTMQSRISAEKKTAVERYSSFGWDKLDEWIRWQWDDMQTMLVELRQSNEKQEIARKILSNDWSVDDLAQHLHNLFRDSLLYNCLKYCASIPSTTVDVTPTPEQKLYHIFHLWTKRLNIILSKGILNTTLRKSLLLSDSAAWGPYISISAFSDYTSLVLSVLANKPHVLTLDNDSLANLRDGVSGVKDMNRESEERRDNPGRGEEGSAEGETGMMNPQKIISSNSLTTLIMFIFTDKPDDEHRKAITDILKQAPNIICLAGTECQIPGEDCTQQHCQSILANRQQWKNGVQDKLSFEYRVGFEGHDLVDVEANGDQIQIQDTGRCFALFYCPGPGELKITFSVSKDVSDRLKLEATLVPDNGSEASSSYEIPVREKKGESEPVTFSFSSVPKGTGSISVREEQRKLRKRKHRRNGRSRLPN